MEHLTTLHAQAPYDLEVTRMFLHAKYGNYGEGQPAAVLEAAYGPVLEYSTRALNLISFRLKEDPEAYERFMARGAERNAAQYFTLADYFAQRDDEARALKYYELGVARCSDAVTVANKVRWLVRYYYNHDKRAEAEKLADAAAEVYSADGLLIKGNLLFWKEQYAESFEYHRRIEERYNRPQCVVEWWVDYRQRTGRSDFDDQIEKRLGTLFPKGRKPAALRDFTSPPETGVLIDGESDRLHAAGLKKGDIIVGFQGQRVETFHQYVYLRTMLANDTLNLLVWDGAKYREVTASPPQGRFGVDFGTYRAR
jgi:tetratricopeptide (TPR) repeat protein